MAYRVKTYSRVGLSLRRNPNVINRSKRGGFFARPYGNPVYADSQPFYDKKPTKRMWLDRDFYDWVRGY